VWRLAVISELVDARYRFVLERCVGTQLEHEASREADVARHAGPDRAHRHAAVKAWVLGLIHRAEAVGVQLTQQAITADELMTVGLELGVASGCAPFWCGASCPTKPEL